VVSMGPCQGSDLGNCLKNNSGFQIPAGAFKTMVKEIKASHILVDDENKAKFIYNKILGKLATFENLAMEESKCPSKKKGGDLGWFGRGRMVKEFENFAFNLKKGEMGIVKTQFGWHVVKKVDET